MSMREQFEAWHKGVVVGDPPHDKYDNGDYVNQHVQRYWVGWQASRAAIEVKLPIIKASEWACSSDECEYIRQGITMSKHAINAAGIKVKP